MKSLAVKRCMLIWKSNYSYQNKFFVKLATIIDKIGGWLFFAKKRSTLDPQKIRKILVVKLDNLGDCYLSLPLFYYLRQLNQTVVVDSLSLASSRQFFENCPEVNHCYSVQKRLGIFQKKLLRTVKENNYDLIIDARGYFSVALFGFLSKIPQRFGFAEEVGQCFYTNLFQINQNQHETTKYFNVLQSLGITVDSWQPKLSLNNFDSTQVNAFLNSAPKVVVVHPVASQPYKYWPLAYWHELIGFLLEKKDCHIFLLGSSLDNDFINKIKDKFPNDNDRLISCAGKLNLVENYALISRSSLFIGNDSVFGHLAGSLVIPTIVLMNRAINRQRWSPLGQKSQVFVAPENNHCCQFDQCGYNCPNMVEIKPSVIIDYIANLET